MLDIIIENHNDWLYAQILAVLNIFCVTVLGYAWYKSRHQMPPDTLVAMRLFDETRIVMFVHHGIQLTDEQIQTLLHIGKSLKACET